MVDHFSGWLTTDDVARRLKIPPKTLANWASAGKGPRFARIGRHRRYPLDELIAWEQMMLEQGGGHSLDEIERRDAA
ncbi:helix-turn-helix domain-containing protein [Nocardia sp. MH4]|uniref:helix-turn-helix domain-containing protein n=1 Tax=Nocardia sp. MH4 TaxID=1768677 RepID=UPI001C4F70B9|nr:helix-turn-helix domain-containing protein [Nocardia sp. MH4]